MYLSYELSETINLGILNRGDVVYIDKAISNNNLRLDSPIGGRDPAHSTALGKSILAFLPKNAVDKYINEYGLIAKTKNTITDPERLHKELAIIKKQRYAFDNQEIVLGVECIAAPIFDNGMNPIAAISVSMPVNEENSKKLQKYKDYIINASKQISSNLGAKI
jgi:IclR family KDG regulon transcriptional repressor